MRVSSRLTMTPHRGECVFRISMVPRPVTNYNGLARESYICLQLTENIHPLASKDARAYIAGTTEETDFSSKFRSENLGGSARVKNKNYSLKLFG